MDSVPQYSRIEWKVGVPTKYGCYLVLCKHNDRLVIHHDVWFDICHRWQSMWHGMFAWCALDDIVTIEKED